MQKKRLHTIASSDETVVHPVGQERFVNIQNYVGDLPSEEPVDWFVQTEEYDPHGFLIGTADTERSEYDG